MPNDDEIEMPKFRGGDHRAQWLSYSCIERECGFCVKIDCRCSCHGNK